jgi:hypothetical protein
MYIYKITNNVNGKIYIGKTKYDFNERYKGKWWMNSLSRDLISDVIEFGKESFTVNEKYFKCKDDKELDKKEKEFILKYNSRKNGYNNLDGRDFWSVKPKYAGFETTEQETEWMFKYSSLLGPILEERTLGQRQALLLHQVTHPYFDELKPFSSLVEIRFEACSYKLGLKNCRSTYKEEYKEELIKAYQEDKELGPTFIKDLNELKQLVIDYERYYNERK